MSAKLTALILEGLHRDFLRDGNPLHVWSAWQMCRFRWEENGPMFEHPLPEWCREYFDSCAADLMAGMSPSKALKLATKGGHSKVRQYMNESRDIGIVSHLEFCMQLEDDAPLLPGESRLDRICERVSALTGTPDSRFSKTKLSLKRLRTLYFRHRSSRLTHR
jgi:hypothetical protein